MIPSGDEPGTLPQWIKYGETFLTGHGIPNARNNAEWILCHVLGCERLALYTADADKHGWNRDYLEKLERRANREPLQYIIGTTEFMSLPFETPAGVFVPRPETEILVEAAEKRLRVLPLERGMTVLDLCCGSGVIAVSLAARTSGLVATAVDVSEPAVEATRRNASLNGVAGRVEAVRSEATSFLETGEYSAILCNPPYIETGEMQNLAPEVHDHEPHVALDGGADGLDFYRRIIPLLPPRLAEGGFVGFEIGDTLGPAVTELLHDNGFHDVLILHDLSNLPRVAITS